MNTTLVKKRFSRGWLSLSILVVLSMIPLTSCITGSEVTYLNDQMTALDKRVKNIEELQNAFDKETGQDLTSSLRSILARQAALSADLDQLREQMMELSGNIEDNDHVIKKIVERDLGELDTMKTGFSDLSQRITNLEIKVMGKPQTTRSEPISAREDEKQARLPTVTEDKTPTVVPPVPVEKESKELTLYNASLASYKEGKFEESIRSFKDFLKQYPKSDLADNAHFWIGESYMALKQYEQAILAFQEVIKKYPKGNKVPGALLKQALAFLEIKDKTSSSLLLKKIIKNYPKSDEAKIARAKLRTLN
jgi:tol-pal system protein YbgF